MKEDILEQLVDGYYLRQPGTFTKHNIKYRPEPTLFQKGDRNRYSVHSDIDILSINLVSRITTVVSCKSWQNGFDVEKYLDLLNDPKNHSNKISGREVWKSFRELTDRIWSKAFVNKIYDETKSKKFDYVIAVTKLKNKHKVSEFCQNEKFVNTLSNNGEFDVSIKFLTLEEMIVKIQDEPQNTAIESTEIGRFLQLLKAADISFKKDNDK